MSAATHRLVVSAPAASRQLDNTSGRVRRASWRETTGAAGAIFQLFDGSGPNGTLLDTIALSAGQSTRDTYIRDEYDYYGGLYLNVISGTFEGVMVVHHLGEGQHDGLPVVIVGQLDINVNGVPS